MRRTLNKLLKHIGWEIQRIGKSRPQTMVGGLRWLSANGFRVQTVLDVGASDGRWSQSCMQFFPQADYLLFEPQPVHSGSLDAFAGRCSQKVIPIKQAVGAAKGTTFFDASDPFGGVLAEQASEKTIEVEVTTIDDCLAELQSADPFLIKLDTHGFEQGILEGADQTLNRTEVLIIESYNYRIAEESLLFWELCEFLAKRGFRPIDAVDVLYREYDRSLWQMDLFFIRSTWPGFNYVSYT